MCDLLGFVRSQCMVFGLFVLLKIRITSVSRRDVGVVVGRQVRGRTGVVGFGP